MKRMRYSRCKHSICFWDCELGLHCKKDRLTKIVVRNTFSPSIVAHLSFRVFSIFSICFCFVSLAYLLACLFARLLACLLDCLIACGSCWFSIKSFIEALFFSQSNGFGLSRILHKEKKTMIRNTFLNRSKNAGFVK